MVYQNIVLQNKFIPVYSFFYADLAIHWPFFYVDLDVFVRCATNHHPFSIDVNVRSVCVGNINKNDS